MDLKQSELEFILKNKSLFDFEEIIISTVENILDDWELHRERCEKQKNEYDDFLNNMNNNIECIITNKDS